MLLQLIDVPHEVYICTVNQYVLTIVVSAWGPDMYGPVYGRK